MKKLMFLAVLALGAAGCSVDNDIPNENIQELNLSFEDNYCGTQLGVPFGDLGNIMVFNDNETLTIRFLSNEPLSLMQARVEIVDNLNEFPINGGGNLPPGQMAEVVKVGGDDYAQFTFPLSNFSHFEDNCLLIAPWAIFKANAGQHTTDPWYFQYCIQSCPPPPPADPVIICETAFMEGNRPFLGTGDNVLNLGNSRWGWANYFTGSDGEYSQKLWAGAGKNNTSKATWVGDIITTVSGTNVTLSIDMKPGFEDALNVTHIYFSDKAPTTTAPGQYGNTDPDAEDGKDYPFTLNVANSSFWLIVHAEICQEE